MKIFKLNDPWVKMVKRLFELFLLSKFHEITPLAEVLELNIMPGSGFHKVRWLILWPMKPSC